MTPTVTLLALVSALILAWIGRCVHRQRSAIRRRRHLEDALKHFFEQEYRGRRGTLSSLAGVLRLSDPKVVDLVGRTSAPRHRRASAEGDFITRWGKKIPVGVTVSPLQDRYGHFVGTILLLRDIKRRKELEEDLKRAIALLIAAVPRRSEKS